MKGNLWAVRPVLMTAAWEPQARWKSNRSLQIRSQVGKVENRHNNYNYNANSQWLVFLCAKYLGWFGSGGSEWDLSARARLGKRFWRKLSRCTSFYLLILHLFLPFRIFLLPCDQVLLVSLVSINDGHLHCHSIQIHHSPYLTRTNNHIQSRPRWLYLYLGWQSTGSNTLI